MKLTIITASYNRCHFLENAIQSVLKQGYDDFEHIIVDGGSKDGTLDLLGKYSHLNVSSEPDLGVYDAWNKGISKASGDIIGILNSDDIYEDNIFHQIAKIFKMNPNLEMVSGNARIVSLSTGHEIEKHIRNFEPSLNIDNLPLWSGAINAIFFKRELLNKIGLFNLKYGLSADCEFLLRLALRKTPCIQIHKFIYSYLSHSHSLTLNVDHKHFIKIGLEKMTIVEDYVQYDLSEHDLKRLKKWHVKIACASCLYALKKGFLSTALKFYSRGNRYHIMLIHLLWFVLSRLGTKLHFRNYL